MGEQTSITREEWLALAGEVLISELIKPLYKPRDTLKIKYSVAYPPYTKPGSSVVAKTLPSHVSSGKFNEIYISPELDDGVEVLGHLVHELIHAIDDCASGHKGLFARLARAVGLEGPLDSTKPSTDLLDILETVVEDLGGLPHFKVDLGAAHKPQSARQIKVYCVAYESEGEPCGFQFYTSAKQINKVLELNGEIACACCGEPMEINN